MTGSIERVIIVGPHSGLKIGQLIATAGLGMHQIVSIDEADPWAIRIAPVTSMDIPELGSLVPPAIDNDPNQTHAHRERRLMLEKQARRQANRRR